MWKKPDNAISLVIFITTLNIIFPLTSTKSLFKREERGENVAGKLFAFNKDEGNFDSSTEHSFLKKFASNANGAESQIDDEVNQLSPNGHRIKRSVKHKNSIAETAYAMNDSNSHLIVHWAGANSSVIVVLTKQMDYNLDKLKSSNLYFSKNYGRTFVRKISSNPSGNMKSGLINNFYSAAADINRYIFTDVNASEIFTTSNAGRSLHRVKVSFSPDAISFHPRNPSIVLAHDKTSKKLYKSDNFGRSWILIQTRVKEAEWGSSSQGHVQYDKEDSLYVQREEPGGSITVLRSETYFQHDTIDQVLISNVDDFVVMNASMFATRSSSSGNGKDLWIAVTRHSRFVKANFHTTQKKLEFFVVDAADSQIMVCVNHAAGITHLYISEPNEVDFVLSLQNITYFSPNGPYSFFSLYASERFADIYKVNGLRSIFIANVMSGPIGRNIYDASSMHSVITFDKGGMWQRIPNPTYDNTGDRINCSVRAGCSLHLTQEFHNIYPQTRSTPIFSQSSAPGFVLAHGNTGKNIKSELDVYFSSTGGKDWTQILSGSWLYTWGDHGGIIAALLKFEKTNLLWYSTNEGQVWSTYKFSNESIRVYGLMTEPGETSTVFTLFGSANRGGHSWLIIQVNLSSILGSPCEKNDYKPWSPTDERGVNCLMGSKTTFERRNKHALCFNGKNYDRPTTIVSCPCTRDDFECDVGYSVPGFFGYYCLPNNSSVSNPQLVPSSCYSGGYYNRTKGYRKLAGDMCSGGSTESHFAPDLVPCPVMEENAFMFVSTSRGLYRVDLESNDTVNVASNIVNTKDIEFDYANNTVFWSNGTFLLKTNLYTSVTSVLFQNDATITRLAYDWLTSNLYWCDGHIHVTNMRGATRQLPAGNCSGSVSSIAVNPPAGLLYFLCYGGTDNYKGVYKMEMDGSHAVPVRVSKNSASTSWRNNLANSGITYDYSTHRLYWLMNNRLETCYENGDGYRYLRYVSGYRNSGISVFKNNLYWLSYSGYGSSVKNADKYDFISARIFRTGIPPYYSMSSIKIFTRQSRNTAVTNPCIKHKCSQLCVPIPKPTGHGIIRKCLCGHSVDTIIVISGGQEQCRCPSSQQFYNATAGYCQATNHSCLSNEFMCSNDQCILSLWRCDGENDCHDGSDELDCPPQNCNKLQFACNNSRCIPAVWKCDHDNDCGDFSDEDGCHYSACTKNQFTCKNGRCKNILWRCDGDDDCGDNSDELNCNTTTITNSTCDPATQFQCAHSLGPWGANCIPRDWVCNNITDCPDRSDEANCSTTTCFSFEKKCGNGLCLFSWLFCDGFDDCGDNSDERNCPTTTPASTLPSTTLPTNHSCSGNDLRCRHSGSCYPLSWHCDGVSDCGDHSDEFDCPTNSSTSGHLMTCLSPLFQFKCANGGCILFLYKCDGDNDCGDWSDERGCPNFHLHTHDPGCIEGYGINYQGTRNYTKTGLTCQRWDSNTPHKPHYRPQDPHNNYCRDPDNDRSGPWCYTTNPLKRWDYCAIPYCATNPSTPIPPTAGTQQCASGYFYCGENLRRRCIFDRYVCDGDNDCGNNADEKNCNFNCTSSQFKCHNRRCIASSLVCNSRDDCYDNSDELNCTTHTVTCDSTTFRCSPSTLCVPSWARCNHQKDCPNGYDEQGCSSTTTAPQFTCANGKALSLNKRCNYQPDCPSKSDEKNCHYFTSVRSYDCVLTNNLHACIHIYLPSVYPAPPAKLGPYYYAVYYKVAQNFFTFSTSNSHIRLASSTQGTVDLKDLKFFQKYSFGIALNFTNYILPVAYVAQFTTSQGPPGPPVVEDAYWYAGTIIVKWKPPVLPNGIIIGYLVTCVLVQTSEVMRRTYPANARQGEIYVNSKGKWKVTMQAKTTVYGNSSDVLVVSSSMSSISTPRKFFVQKLTQSSVTLSWTAVTHNATGYIVQTMSTQSVFYNNLQVVAKNPTYLSLCRLAPGQQFQSRIATKSHNISSRYSPWIFFTTNGSSSAIPTILLSKSKALTTSSVYLQWNPVNNSFTKGGVTYQVQYGENEHSLEQPKYIRNLTHTTITGLRHNAVYLFRVAVSSPYIGRWSPFESLVPKHDYTSPPLRLKVTLHGGMATISWNSPFPEYSLFEKYQINIIDLDNGTSLIYNKTAHSAAIIQSAVPVALYRMYKVTVRSVNGGKYGSPATYIFFSGLQISPPSSLKAIRVAGTSDYRLSYVIPTKFQAYYQNVVRGVEVTLCEGNIIADTSSSTCSCTSYHELSATQTDVLLTKLTNNKWYTVFLTLRCPYRQECSGRFSKISFLANGLSSNSLNKTNVIAIAVSAAVIIIVVVGVIVFLIRRNHRLRNSYNSFVSSHYDPQRGEAIFVNDADDFDNGLDDDADAETPMISGFADDEPLIVA